MVAHLDCSSANDVMECAKLIDKGGIVIFPTDTVYGIGCDPTNEPAVINLFTLKERPLNKTLPLLTFSQTIVSEIAQISQSAKRLMDKFWPGQLTLVLNYKTNQNIKLSKYVLDNANQSIAVRIPGSECIRDIIRSTKCKLLVGTSANISQRPSSKNFSELDLELVSKCDALVQHYPTISAWTQNVAIAETEDTATIKEAAIKGNFIHWRQTTHLTRSKTTATPLPLTPPDPLYSYARGTQPLKTTKSESTIIDLTDENRPLVIREGAVPKFKIIEALKTAS